MNCFPVHRVSNLLPNECCCPMNAAIGGNPKMDKSSLGNRSLPFWNDEKYCMKKDMNLGVLSLNVLYLVFHKPKKWNWCYCCILRLGLSFKINPLLFYLLCTFSSVVMFPALSVTFSTIIFVKCGHLLQWDSTQHAEFIMGMKPRIEKP